VTINGTGSPRLIVTSVTNNVHNPLASVNLPFCEKLTETFTPGYVIHEVQRGILVKEKGWEYRARLDYTSYLEGIVLLDLQKSLEMIFGFDEGENERKLVLVPRIDCPERHYNVIFEKPFSMSTIFPDVGHSDVVFEFRGCDIEPTPRFLYCGYGSHFGGVNFDSTPSAGYGFQL
jgi:hypothetical protein